MRSSTIPTWPSFGSASTSSAARVLATRGAFEPVLSTIVGRSSIATPPTSSFLGSEPIDTSEWFSSAGVRQRLRSGRRHLERQLGRRRASARTIPFSSFDPSLQSGLLLAFSQPLFKDRQIDEARHQYIIAARQQVSAELLSAESVVQTVADVKQAVLDPQGDAGERDGAAAIGRTGRGSRPAEPRACQRRPGAADRSRAGRGRGGAAAREPHSRGRRGRTRRIVFAGLIMDPPTSRSGRRASIRSNSRRRPFHRRTSTHAVSVAMKERYDLARARLDARDCGHERRLLRQPETA